MSLVTTCPDCGTAFKVKPEQLTARRGDVCCGKCGFIFNALDHLTETPAQEQAETREASAETLAGELEGADEKTDVEVVIIDGIDDETSTEIDVVPDTEMPPAEEPQDEAIANLETTEHFELRALVPDAATEEMDQSADSIPVPEMQPSAEVLPESEPTIKFELLDPEPKRRFSALLPGMLAVLLLFASLGQGAYFLRTQLAAQYPPAKPYLAQLCNILGCTVELPRQADLLAIDESDLQRDAEHENVVILFSTLINHARYAQAYPVLEVTLTDANDHPLLRRLFRPDEYLPKGTDLKAGMPTDADTRVKLHLTTGDIKATGYRVYVSYL